MDADENYLGIDRVLALKSHCPDAEEVSFFKI